MIWIGRHKGAPNIRVVYDTDKQNGVPSGHIRLVFLHHEPDELNGEVTGEAWRIRNLVRPELDKETRELCIEIYKRLVS